LCTKEADAYSIGKVALHIWNDEWDKNLFKTTSGASIFLSKLNALINKDPKKRPSLASILDIFTSLPTEWNCQIFASTMIFRVIAFA
jgi:hypothetical protein